MNKHFLNSMSKMLIKSSAILALLYGNISNAMTNNSLANYNICRQPNNMPPIQPLPNQHLPFNPPPYQPNNNQGGQPNNVLPNRPLQNLYPGNQPFQSYEQPSQRPPFNTPPYQPNNNQGGQQNNVLPIQPLPNQVQPNQVQQPPRYLTNPANRPQQTGHATAKYNNGLNQQVIHNNPLVIINNINNNISEKISKEELKKKKKIDDHLKNVKEYSTQIDNIVRDHEFKKKINEQKTLLNKILKEIKEKIFNNEDVMYLLKWNLLRSTGPLVEEINEEYVYNKLISDTTIHLTKKELSTEFSEIKTISECNEIVRLSKKVIKFLNKTIVSYISNYPNAKYLDDARKIYFMSTNLKNLNEGVCKYFGEKIKNLKEKDENNSLEYDFSKVKKLPLDIKQLKDSYPDLVSNKEIINYIPNLPRIIIDSDSDESDLDEYIKSSPKHTPLYTSQPAKNKTNLCQYGENLEIPTRDFNNKKEINKDHRQKDTHINPVKKEPTNILLKKAKTLKLFENSTKSLSPLGKIANMSENLNEFSREINAIPQNPELRNKITEQKKLCETVNNALFNFLQTHSEIKKNLDIRIDHSTSSTWNSDLPQTCNSVVELSNKIIDIYQKLKEYNNLPSTVKSNIKELIERKDNIVSLFRENVKKIAKKYHESKCLHYDFKKNIDEGINDFNISTQNDDISTYHVTATESEAAENVIKGAFMLRNYLNDVDPENPQNVHTADKALPGNFLNAYYSYVITQIKDFVPHSDYKDMYLFIRSVIFEKLSEVYEKYAKVVNKGTGTREEKDTKIKQFAVTIQKARDVVSSTDKNGKENSQFSPHFAQGLFAYFLTCTDDDSALEIVTNGLLENFQQAGGCMPGHINRITHIIFNGLYEKLERDYLNGVSNPAYFALCCNRSLRKLGDIYSSLVDKDMADYNYFEKATYDDLWNKLSDGISDDTKKYLCDKFLSFKNNRENFCEKTPDTLYNKIEKDVFHSSPLERFKTVIEMNAYDNKEFITQGFNFDISFKELFGEEYPVDLISFADGDMFDTYGNNFKKRFLAALDFVATKDGKKIDLSKIRSSLKKGTNNSKVNTNVANFSSNEDEKFPTKEEIRLFRDDVTILQKNTVDKIVNALTKGQKLPLTTDEINQIKDHLNSQKGINRLLFRLMSRPDLEEFTHSGIDKYNLNMITAGDFNKNIPLFRNMYLECYNNLLRDVTKLIESVTPLQNQKFSPSSTINRNRTMDTNFAEPVKKKAAPEKNNQKIQINSMDAESKKLLNTFSKMDNELRTVINDEKVLPQSIVDKIAQSLLSSKRLDFTPSETKIVLEYINSNDGNKVRHFIYRLMSNKFLQESKYASIYKFHLQYNKVDAKHLTLLKDMYLNSYQSLAKDVKDLFNPSNVKFNNTNNIAERQVSTSRIYQSTHNEPKEYRLLKTTNLSDTREHMLPRNRRTEPSHTTQSSRTDQELIKDVYSAFNKFQGFVAFTEDDIYKASKNVITQLSHMNEVALSLIAMVKDDGVRTTIHNAFFTKHFTEDGEVFKILNSIGVKNHLDFYLTVYQRLEASNKEFGSYKGNVFSFLKHKILTPKNEGMSKLLNQRAPYLFTQSCNANMILNALFKIIQKYASKEGFL